MHIPVARGTLNICVSEILKMFADILSKPVALPVAPAVKGQQ